MLSPASMSSLADDDDIDVRCALSGNLGISEELINTLLQDSAKKVRDSLSRNYAVPYEVRATLQGTTFINRIERLTARLESVHEDPISVELQILVVVAGLAASWAIYFAIRWLAELL
jgi:hypothetical protein